MRKLLILALALGSAAAFAAEDTVARRAIEDIQRGRTSGDNQIRNLYVDETVRLPAGSIETADLADGAVTSAKLKLDVTAATPVTNGQTIALAAGKINYLYGTGQASGLTNVIHLSDFAAADVGKPTYIVNHFYLGTNNLLVEVDGNYYGRELNLEDGDAAVIIPVATNVLHSILGN